MLALFRTSRDTLLKVTATVSSNSKSAFRRTKAAVLTATEEAEPKKTSSPSEEDLADRALTQQLSILPSRDATLLFANLALFDTDEKKCAYYKFSAIGLAEEAVDWFANDLGSLAADLFFLEDDDEDEDEDVEMDLATA